MLLSGCGYACMLHDAYAGSLGRSWLPPRQITNPPAERGYASTKEAERNRAGHRQQGSEHYREH